MADVASRTAPALQLRKYRGETLQSDTSHLKRRCRPRKLAHAGRDGSRDRRMRDLQRVIAPHSAAHMTCGVHWTAGVTCRHRRMHARHPHRSLLPLFFRMRVPGRTPVAVGALPSVPATCAPRCALHAGPRRHATVRPHTHAPRRQGAARSIACADEARTPAHPRQARTPARGHPPGSTRATTGVSRWYGTGWMRPCRRRGAPG